MKEIKDIISKVVSKVPDAQVMKDLDATVAYAKKSGKADVSKLAITGFCWGGRIVWLYAAHNKNLKAGAAWSGRLGGDTEKLPPKNPINLVASPKTPALGPPPRAPAVTPPQPLPHTPPAPPAQPTTPPFV